ncbi:MAG: 23S rRNA (cytosine1962-C5)-methyltransferase [Hyphomonadaceae bacterium]|nr:MAG: 23S rRNA (cytosine1962-C5)-methyltransferase [Hyphomonadaceae bacterium]KAF0186771.1 MAG: 23S rRNA (cytosine1962-C5)-methyltransferase [Hyphomonadaceae bacterium]
MSKTFKQSSHSFPILIADEWQDYELLDSGEGHKLERFGDFLFMRPDSQAYWKPANPISEWRSDATFSGRDGEELGRWGFHSSVPQQWPMKWNGLDFYARCTPFRHLGFFPEQSVHWSWCQNLIAKSKRQPKILNLFGYTGLASLVCAKAGAHVTHVDASKKAIAYARENQEIAGLNDLPIRWIVDDAMKFIEREHRRGNKYDGIILDPPKHGRGPNGEVFKLEEDLTELVAACANLLSKDALFMVLTVYAVRLSFVAIKNIAEDCLSDREGTIEAGEMALSQAKSGRLLPTAIYARWKNS